MGIATKKRKTVLIVEDSLIILERMITALEEVEAIDFVMHAGTHKEASDLLGQLTPDLVLLDINLPDKSGIELLKTIKENDNKVTVFMVTNHASEHYRTICKNLGADYFIDKSKDFYLIPEVISASS